MTAFETTIPVRLTPTSKVFDREADIPYGGTVHFGAHGGVAEHYKMPATAEPLPTTIDYLVASVAGCLIGTFAGSLRRAKVRVSPEALTGVATGSVESDEDNVLRLRRITVDYTLQLPEGEDESTVQEVHAAHAGRCPNARSVGGCIDIVTTLRIAQPVTA